MRLIPYTNSEKMDFPENTEAQQAFSNALDSGRLSLDENAYNYVGDYMYMGRNASGEDAAFKHKITRQYLTAEAVPKLVCAGQIWPCDLQRQTQGDE